MGITAENISQLKGTGICGVAVISAIYAQNNNKEAAEEAKKVFGDVEIISLGQLPQECAFITDEMTQGAFEEKLAQIGDQVLAKIRVKD